MALAIQVVTIGNEILAGFTINTNAAVIGQALLGIGLKVSSQCTLPDEAGQVKAGLEHSLNFFDLIICTGGLGPTCDDKTRQIIADLFNCELKFEPKIAEYLHARYHDRPVSINDQAMIPENAEYILNDLGTASALIFNENDKLIIFLPGVPSELEHFMSTKIIGILKDKYKDQVKEVHQQCNFLQLSESQIDPMLRKLGTEYPLAEFGIYPNLGILSVHIITNFATETENLNYQAPIKAKLIAAFKDHFFSDTTSKLEQIICQLCTNRNLTLGIIQTSPYLNLSSMLAPVLVKAVYANTINMPPLDCNITLIITGMPLMEDDTAIYTAELKIDLQFKPDMNSTKTHSIYGNKAMMIKRAENLVLSELYKNLCYTA